MTNSKNPSLVIPRHLWLKERIRECIGALQKVEETENWELYLKQSLELANEIKYCAVTWEKCYRDNQ